MIRLTVSLLLVMLAACAGPAGEYRRAAIDAGLETRLVRGAGFDHVVFGRAGPGAPRLRVYLEGDGTPYSAGRPAGDPTPRRPMALRLLTLDPGPAVLLGRPCYHGPRRGCKPGLWTADRYGEAVVASMAAALRRLVAVHEARELVLIGYSGGGTLAMLLAPRLPETVAVITIAGNLDPTAWAAHHGYPPLPPAALPPYGAFAELHFAGARDSVVPPDLTADAIAPRGAPAPEIVPGFDHICCWEDFWPLVLDRLSRTP